MEYTTNFFKDVLMAILFICSCFSVVLWSIFVGYHLPHVEPIDSTSGNFLAKIPTTKIPFGEISVWRNFRSA